MTEPSDDVIGDSEDSRALRAAFATELSLTVQTREELRALTASAEGGVLLALLASGPTAFWVSYCQALGAALANHHSSKLGELMRRRQLILADGSVRVVLEPELPTQAFEQLAQPLPRAPSGELIDDREARRWKDSLDG